MYIDAKGGQCVTLAMNLGGTSSQWDIQITTLDCDDTNLAPSGCTQYFYGQQSGQIKTFNWAGGEHLANQNQRICFRYICLNINQEEYISYRYTKISFILMISQNNNFDTILDKKKETQRFAIPLQPQRTSVFQVSKLIDEIRHHGLNKIYS